MAKSDRLICATPGCGKPLASVPGLCECGTFWSSSDELAAAWVQQRAARGEAAQRSEQASQSSKSLHAPTNASGAASASASPDSAVLGGLGSGSSTGASAGSVAGSGAGGNPLDWFRGDRPDGQTSSSGQTVLSVPGYVIALPVNVEVVLGRLSNWAQIAAVFEKLRHAADPLGESARGVSRRHASVTVLGSRVRIVDVGSRNGTWIAGREIIGKAVVRDIPLTVGLGVPGLGLDVEIRQAKPGERVSEWTGVNRG